MKHVAVGIIIDNWRVLVCQRKPTVPYPLKWEFPGGKLEHNETVVQALLRELREELSIEVTAHEAFFEQDWVYEEGVDDPVKDGTFMVSYFLIHSYRGTLANLAFRQIEWVTPSQLLTMDILDGNRRAIERLVSYIQGQNEA